MLDGVGDVYNVRMALTRIKATLNIAAVDYAKAGLNAAQEAYTAASDAAPCSVVWKHMVEAQEFNQKASATLQMCLSSTALLLHAEQTGDDDIDQQNGTVKVEAIEQPVIAALIEGANSRLMMAKARPPL